MCWCCPDQGLLDNSILTSFSHAFVCCPLLLFNWPAHCLCWCYSYRINVVVSTFKLRSLPAHYWPSRHASEFSGIVGGIVNKGLAILDNKTTKTEIKIKYFVWDKWEEDGGPIAQENHNCFDSGIGVCLEKSVKVKHTINAKDLGGVSTATWW